MRLMSVAISNIRSFEYSKNPQEISFDARGLNLIIGPNGSGKSNLVEILTRLFTQVYGADLANYNEDLSRLISTVNHQQDLNTILTKPSTFTKHRSSQNKESSIKLKIMLDEVDLKNLAVINDNREVLKRIYNRYFKVENDIIRIFDEKNHIPAEPTVYEIELKDTLDLGYDKAFIETDPDSVQARYLRDYKLVANLINIHNDLLYKESFVEISRQQNMSYQGTLDALLMSPDMEPIQPMQSLVLLMSVQDRINDINLEYTAAPSDNMGIKTTMIGRTRVFSRQLLTKTTMGTLTAAQSEAFEMLKSTIYEECAIAVSGRRTKEEVVVHVNKTDRRLKLINEFLETFALKIKLAEFDPRRNRIVFTLEHSETQMTIADMSTGQKALMSIATYLVLGSELQSLVLIDEVENHLHPITQQQLRDSLSKLSRKSIQAICVTHSPVFISPATIGTTLRVSMKKGATNIKACAKATTKDSKALINVLQYSNGARIFFTKKVLLVEGPSDEEFFTAYLQKFHPNEDMSVLSTNTKGQIKNWRKIIEEFDILVCSISDLDDAKKGEIKRRAGHEKREGMSLRKVDVDPDEYSQVLLPNIATKRIQHSYILREGALESYVPGRSKDKVQRVRDFLGQQNWSRVKHLSEIRAIMSEIVQFNELVLPPGLPIVRVAAEEFEAAGLGGV